MPNAHPMLASSSKAKLANSRARECRGDDDNEIDTHSVRVVIPFKWSLIKPDALLRLLANCTHLKRLGLGNISIADGSRWRLPTRVLAIILNVEHQAVECPEYYSPALIKNSAAQRAPEASHLLFLDVDVLINKATARDIAAEARKDTKFTWWPVIFLDKTHATTRMLTCGLLGTQNASIRQRVQIGYTTGIQLIKRDFFIQIGGYQQAFRGYGCEDIEMIHRATGLLRQRPLFDSTSGYYQDVRSHDPERLAGYRKLFFDLRKEVPLEAMPTHFWHKRKNKSSYMQRRNENDQLLTTMMVEFDKARSFAETAGSASSA